MHHPLAWLAPLAIVGLYLVWGLTYQARHPATGSDRSVDER